MTRPANLLDLFTGTRGSVPYEPAQRFLKLHTINYVDDRVGNGDEVYKGTTEVYPRDEHRHGYKPGEDIETYTKNNEDLVAYIQQAHKAVAQRWLAAAQDNEDGATSEVMSRLAPIISQVAAKY